jgi:hypothetical protein
VPTTISRPQPEDALHDRCGPQVHVLGDREGDGRGRVDLELVVLVDLRMGTGAPWSR